jgi:hypothetical protein
LANRGKEFEIMSTANRSDSSDIGQSLNIIAGMIILDIVLGIIISAGIVL